MRFVLLALLFAATSVPALAADKPKPEPKYEGKPLDYWVKRLPKAETDEARDAAANAIKAFGEDAARRYRRLWKCSPIIRHLYRVRVIHIITTIGPKRKKPARSW